MPLEKNATKIDFGLSIQHYNVVSISFLSFFFFTKYKYENRQFLSTLSMLVSFRMNIRTPSISTFC